MAEVTITRKFEIVVDTVESNQYDDLLFTDKGGNNYKVGNKRVHFFEGIVVPDAAVQLNYATAYGNEYIYNAVQVKGELPPPTFAIQPVPQEDEPPPEELETLDKAMSEKGSKDRGSFAKYVVDDRTHDIHRQVALKCAVELVSHGFAKIGELKSTSNMLLKYLDGE